MLLRVSGQNAGGRQLIADSLAIVPERLIVDHTVPSVGLTSVCVLWTFIFTSYFAVQVIRTVSVFDRCVLQFYLYMFITFVTYLWIFFYGKYFICGEKCIFFYILCVFISPNSPTITTMSLIHMALSCHIRTLMTADPSSTTVTRQDRTDTRTHRRLLRLLNVSALMDIPSTVYIWF